MYLLFVSNFKYITGYKLTLLIKPKQEYFWGFVLYFQSFLVIWSCAARIGTSLFNLGMPPASRRRTVTWGSSDKRLATTDPAEPAPTLKIKNIYIPLSTGLLLLSLRYYIFRFCISWIKTLISLEYRIELTLLRTHTD